MIQLIDRPTATKKIKLRVMELMHDLMMEKVGTDTHRHSYIPSSLISRSKQKRVKPISTRCKPNARPSGIHRHDAVCSSVHLRRRLVERDWCSHLSLHLTSIAHDDLDQIEKTLMLMIPLADACRVQFVARLPTLDKLNDVYAKLQPNDESVQRDILRSLERLRKNLTEAFSNSSNDL